jgi:hypothetical protein
MVAIESIFDIFFILFGATFLIGVMWLVALGLMYMTIWFIRDLRK